MPIGIGTEGAAIVLTDSDAVRSTTSNVEVFTPSGQRLHARTWAPAQRQLTIPIAGHHPTLIVKVTDSLSGRYITQKIAIQ